MPLKLRELQNFVYRLVTAPNGVEDGLAAENRLSSGGISAMIRGDARLIAIERVGIYADMYFYRLLAAIREDFPATFRVIGPVNFHNLVTAFLVEHPPGQPSINEASRHLAEFAGSSQWLRNWPFVPDLIRLERALLEVFLGADAEPLSFDELYRTPPQEWSSLRIGVHPAIQLLDCGWRVDVTLRALEQERPLSTPGHEPRSIHPRVPHELGCKLSRPRRHRAKGA
jgi:Putative DNA-binding domain